MKKRILLVFLAMVLAVSLVAFAACTEEEEAPPVVEEAPPVVKEEAPPVVEVWQWPERLAIISSTGVGLAATTGYMSEMAKGTGMAMRVIPEGNTMLRFKWLQTGRFFACSEASSTIRDVLEAVGGYAVRDGGPYQLRIIWAYSKSDAGYVVRGDSEIKTIYDIKPGHKLANLTFVPGYWKWMQGLLSWAGVDDDDVIEVPVSSSGAGGRAISGGQADVMFFFPAHPASMEAAAAPNGIRWLDLPAKEDPEGATRFLEFQPTAEFGVMSQSPEAIDVLGIVANVPILTRAEEDTELVYNYAKWLDENYDLYKDNHVWNQYMTIDTLMEILASWFVPAHDGLIKYLKEKELWTAAHDARQAQNIELITRYAEAYQEAINLADDQGIAVTPENEEWIELWENYKKQLGLPKIKMYVGLEE